MIDLDHLNAVASIHFGLPYGVGEDLTPKAFSHLMKEYKYKSKIEESRYALICCTIANCHRSKGKRAYKISDFMSNNNREKKTNKELYHIMKTFAIKHNSNIK